MILIFQQQFIRNNIEIHSSDSILSASSLCDYLFKYSYQDESYSVVLDKGTVDALMTDDTEEVSARMDRMLNEVGRVLRYMTSVVDRVGDPDPHVFGSPGSGSGSGSFPFLINVLSILKQCLLIKILTKNFNKKFNFLD